MEQYRDLTIEDFSSKTFKNGKFYAIELVKETDDGQFSTFKNVLIEITEKSIPLFLVKPNVISGPYKTVVRKKIKEINQFEEFYNNY